MKEKKVLCKKEDLKALSEKILKEFKTYCDSCFTAGNAVSYINHINVAIKPGETPTEENYSIFQWGNSPTYYTEDVEVAEAFTQGIIFPCINYALTLKQQNKWFYRSAFHGKSVEYVRLIPNNKVKAVVDPDAELTSNYFS